MNGIAIPTPLRVSRRGVYTSAVLTLGGAFSMLVSAGVALVGCNEHSSFPPTASASSAPAPSPGTPATTAPSPTPGNPGGGSPSPSDPGAVVELAAEPQVTEPLSAPPASVGNLLEESDVDLLAAQASDTTLEAELRYTALRRLEEVDRDRAVTVALTLVNDPSRLVQVNALALLARSSDPRAQGALAGLDPQSRRVAAVLAAM